MRRYEGVERGNRRFLEIGVKDRFVVMTTGLIDKSRKPSTTKSEWSNQKDAEAEAERIITKRLKAGFKLVGKPAPKPAPKKAKVTARDRKLIEAIRAKPDEPALWLAYAKALRGKGDPRGDLIVVQEERARRPNDRALVRREDEIFDAHYETLVGRLVIHQPRFRSRGRSDGDRGVGGRIVKFETTI